MEDDRIKVDRSGEPESLGFASEAERALTFLTQFGYRLLKRDPCQVTFEGRDRYVAMCFDPYSYGIGVEIVRRDNPTESTSTGEVLLARGGKPRHSAGSTPEGVRAAVDYEARQLAEMSDLLTGPLPMNEVNEYRRKLTDYYSGKAPKP
jgi:hypothetical protein